MLAKKVSRIRRRPACPARRAAAMLRRAFVRPILAAPPVRAIQASHILKSKVGNTNLEKNLLELQAENGYMKGNLTDLF
jgi:hypothetical protein